ncbi:MAG TPA: hypothetical protein IAB03_04390 [Candidatus Gallibacteroides avistercoris]|uniref:Uncharacterized protein n=1 Tax=Candidatus Gallibacteroides avistercoris TaxID=2840833 RepID=A0A9D1M6Z2_9BACT|nr:hypothetical protein [Candidatus Gallibacteroides avistercoris]
MKIYKLLLLSALPALGLLSSCEDMDENYKQYEVEDVYSGKVLNLTARVGFESAILSWDNPQDQISKGIEIVVVGNDTVSYSFDFATLTPSTPDLVIYEADSIRINNLNQGTAYEMTVYTVDAYGNRSIDVMVPVMPLSQEAYDAIVPPICAGTIDGNGNTAINFQGLTSLSFNFAGTINYQVFDGETLYAEGVATAETVDDDGDEILVNTLVAAVPGLKPDKQYKVKFETDVLPLSGNTPIEDTVTLLSESNLFVSISGISGLDYTMGDGWVEVSYQQPKNELAKTILVTSEAFPTGKLELPNTADSEGGSFRVDGLTANQAVKFTVARVDENGKASDAMSIDATPATQAQLNTITNPTLSISKDILGYMTLNASNFGDNDQFKTKGDADDKTNLKFIIEDEAGNEVFNDVITFPVGEGSFSLGLSQLDTEATYTVKYEFECYPKINGRTSEDSFVLRRAHTIENGSISAGSPIDSIE